METVGAWECVLCASGVDVEQDAVVFVRGFALVSVGDELVGCDIGLRFFVW